MVVAADSAPEALTNKRRLAGLVTGLSMTVRFRASSVTPAAPPTFDQARACHSLVSGPSGP
jgi:hypothetical protein